MIKRGQIIQLKGALFSEKGHIACGWKKVGGGGGTAELFLK